MSELPHRPLSSPAHGSGSGGGASASAAEPAGRDGRCHRPWGWFETLTDGDGYRVKRLFLHPGRRISLQRHGHRCEHWVVVCGRGRLSCGDALMPAEPGTSLFIPVGAIHRAEAHPAGAGLEIIEVQRGDWLSEDDIERFADDYGRQGPANQPAAPGPVPPSSGM